MSDLRKSPVPHEISLSMLVLSLGKPQQEPGAGKCQICPSPPAQELPGWECQAQENLSGDINLNHCKVPAIRNLLATGEYKQDKAIFCFVFLHCVLFSSLA